MSELRTQGTGGAALPSELARLSLGYYDLAKSVDLDLDVETDRGRAGALAGELTAVVCRPGTPLDDRLRRCHACALTLVTALDSCDAARARHLVVAITQYLNELTAEARVPDGGEGASLKGESGADGRLLMCLARLLPAAERQRFVAEALGNLSGCEHWRQRIDHLVCLALGMPRLAWMMWRDGRRGRV